MIYGKTRTAALIHNESNSDMRAFQYRPELAWAAGLFEGAGSVYVGGRSRRAVAKLAMTDEDVVRKFARAVGTGSIGGPYRNKKYPDNKPYWHWRIAGYVQVTRLSSAIGAWLGARLTDRFQSVLKTCARPRDPAACGTLSGYQRHLRQDTTPCDACRAASRAYRRNLRTSTAMAV